ncbi:hypothetical protein vseg_005789 [Gypsophila vaccaria]
MGRADVCQNGESSSGSRFTRSHVQAGPVWTVQDMFILVNEIAAVEGDCQDALSSFQKWKIIAENCTALEVVRNANQCRRKWESLLTDYNAVKEWESICRHESYWSLECGRRQETGLPVDFDKDLYKAIDEFMKGTEQANTESENDSDPEAVEVDVLEAATSGSKPRRVVNRSARKKNRSVGRKQIALKEEYEKPVPTVKDMEQILATKLSENVNTGPKPKKVKLQPTLERSTCNETKPVLSEDHDKPVPIAEDVEQILAAKVKEKTELIHAILASANNHTADEEMPDVNDNMTLKMERVKCTAEKLIACFADLGKNLEQLCDVVKER